MDVMDVWDIPCLGTTMQWPAQSVDGAEIPVFTSEPIVVVNTSKMNALGHQMNSVYRLIAGL